MNSSWAGRESDSPLSDTAARVASGVVISRTIGLSPEWAELALGAAVNQAATRSSVRRVGGSLQLQSRTVADDAYGPRRRLTGSLVSKRNWFRMPVELELSEWSASATELTLRPLARGRRPGWGPWYLRVGTRIMDLLVAAIHDPTVSANPHRPNTRFKINEPRNHNGMGVCRVPNGTSGT